MTTSATAPPPYSPRWRSRPGKSPTAATSGTARPSSLDFLKAVARAYPRRRLHVACDNYHTHKHADVNAWLAKNPRITPHFTPTSGSWLNLVEVFFSIITRQAIRRGSFDSVKELMAAIGAFIDGWNQRCHPFFVQWGLFHGHGHSCGPRPQTKSCPTPVNKLQTRHTSPVQLSGRNKR